VVKVVANEELPDGTSVLVVSGRERIQVVSWEKEPSYPRAVYRKLERDETEGADTIISLLKDGFESVLSGISGEDRKLVLEHLDSMQSLEAVIDVVAQYTVVDEKMRRYFLEEDSDSERASKLLLYLEGK
jgi:ATP-dependent Lon protease